jgi:hypothetical protein
MDEKAERKPLSENAIAIVPRAHSKVPQNFVALHGMRVGPPCSLVIKAAPHTYSM